MTAVKMRYGRLKIEIKIPLHAIKLSCWGDRLKQKPQIFLCQKLAEEPEKTVALAIRRLAEYGPDRPSYSLPHTCLISVFIAFRIENCMWI